jgi:carbamate kinase
MTPRQRRLVVVAVGGNALLQRGERLDIVAERVNVALAAGALAELAGAADLAVVHGNGPQVGLLALESEAGPAPMPLDVLDAESQGQTRMRPAFGGALLVG